MSGPVTERDLDPGGTPGDRETHHHGPVEAIQGRAATLPGVNIVRVLPTKGRRTVGPWCFVDCILPSDAADPDPMEVGPHPHIGLSTVTWLFDGEAVHTDSLGTEQLIRPGQLNLMTAGNGIAHAELGMGIGLKGVQMWLAQSEDTRHGAAAFAHHADLPTYATPIGDGTVFMGRLGDVTSPAQSDRPLVGAQLDLRSGSLELPADTAFEHAVVPLDQPVKVGEAIVEPGYLGFIPAGQDHLHLEAPEQGARVMLYGGEPFETISMWWNFVARSHEEITVAWRDWQAHDTDRFPHVDSSLGRIDAPRPPWLRAED